MSFSYTTTHPIWSKTLLLLLPLVDSDNKKMGWTQEPSLQGCLYSSQSSTPFVVSSILWGRIVKTVRVFWFDRACKRLPAYKVRQDELLTQCIKVNIKANGSIQRDKETVREILR